ncbi:DEAD/DEAH box helicase family protein [Halomonas sp. PGE1]|uniref:DEAD/DEAH box helicase n=1 Tax=Halomonas sp. PGE1 TaxID=2730360 RepID=UPI0014756236|nr:DEAD/DEAH box helicase family protein [Halomonas sp. PGE1]QJQ99356.1 DEAD/DEAH box helicase family protein [Halomonas sp. PGE1]
MILPPTSRHPARSALPPLRPWQSACLQQALATLSPQHPHFLCQATPGAGKMRLAAELANELMARGDIDYVLYCGPTRAVVQAAIEALQTVTGQPMHGQLGAAGAGMTYQALPGRLDALKRLGQQHRVLLVWDESHHAAGHLGGEGPNQWGSTLMALERHMAYTLALSGTPWRTDGSCMPLLRYLEIADDAKETAGGPGASEVAMTGRDAPASSASQVLQPDFVYTLQDAIRDGVCRYPRVQLVDNRAIELSSFHPRTGRQETHRYASIPQLLRHPAIDYGSLVRLDAPMQRLLALGTQQLNSLRQRDHQAAGLVVAADIEHAEAVTQQLEAEGHEVCLVTSRDPLAHVRLEAFRLASTPWIVAVGMVAEGVDIPRLRVGCYLSHIRTEQHFRQVLGRIIRRQGEDDPDCYFFALNDTRLAQMARRLSDDLPQDLAKVSVNADLPGPMGDHGASPPADSPITPHVPDPAAATTESPSDTTVAGRSVAVSMGAASAAGTISVAPDVAFSASFFERLIALRLTP